MDMANNPPRGDRQARALARALNLIINEREPLIVVDSPPGSGKTELIVSIVWLAVARMRMRVAVVTPRASQANELIRRLSEYTDQVGVQVLQSAKRALPSDLEESPAIRRVASKARELTSRPGVVIGTASKFIQSAPDFRMGEFDVLLCEEAYQLMYKDFMPLAKLAECTCLVGDPGQLSPLVRTATDRFQAMPVKVHWPAPKELRRRFSNVPVIRLPQSLRLRQDTVDIVQPTLYPDLPFASGASEQARQVRFELPSSGDAIDRALALCAEGASIVCIALPEQRSGGGPDEELAELMAEVARRILERGAEWVGRGKLSARDIGCIDPHVAAGAAVRRYLQQKGLSPDELLTDTPECFQGLQRPVTILRHPLSGKSRLSPFEMDPGRLCVMLTRHLLFTVIVGRLGTEEALRDHLHSSADRVLGAENGEWLGWRSHVRLWRTLRRLGRIVRV